jgi:predicted PurR-regulated permease PerM
MDQQNKADIYSKLDVVLISTGFLLFFLFLYFIKETLSPILIAFTILLLLLPVIKYRAVKNLLIVTLILFFIWLAYNLISIFILIAFGMLFAYLLDPLIDKMCKFVKRPIAVLVVLLVIFSLLGLVIFFLLPRLLDTLQKFNLPSTLTNIRNSLTNIIYPYVDQFGLHKADLRKLWETKVIPGMENLLIGLFSGLTNIGDIVINLFKQILYFFILPFFIYYILVDWNKMKTFFKELFPLNKQQKFDYYAEKVDGILNSYIRGLIIVAALNAFDVTILMYLLGHEYPVLIGLISGLFTFIPQFGIIISLAVNSIVGLMTANPGYNITITLIVLMGHNILETAVISPKLVGKKINVHPALLIVSIFVFAYLFGFAGLFIAAPVTAIIVSIYSEWKVEKKKMIDDEIILKK